MEAVVRSTEGGEFPDVQSPIHVDTKVQEVMKANNQELLNSISGMRNNISSNSSQASMLEIPKFKRNETLAIVCEMDGMLQLAGTCKLVSSEPWKKGLSLPDGSPLGTLNLSILFYTLLANSFCV